MNDFFSVNGITMKGFIDENDSIWKSLVVKRHNTKDFVDTNIRTLKRFGDKNIMKSYVCKKISNTAKSVNKLSKIWEYYERFLVARRDNVKGLVDKRDSMKGLVNVNGSTKKDFDDEYGCMKGFAYKKVSGDIFWFWKW